VAHLIEFSFLHMNALLCAHRQVLFRKKKRTCIRNTKCLGLSPCAERFSDAPSGARIKSHDSQYCVGGVEPRTERRNEKQLYPDRSGNGSNAMGMVAYHAVQWKDIVRHRVKRLL